MVLMSKTPTFVPGHRVEEGEAGGMFGEGKEEKERITIQERGPR